MTRSRTRTTRRTITLSPLKKSSRRYGRSQRCARQKRTPLISGVSAFYILLQPAILVTTSSSQRPRRPKQGQVTTIRIIEARRLPVESSTYSLSTRRNSARALSPETLKSRAQDSLLSITVNQSQEALPWLKERETKHGKVEIPY
jgi:hypothetical protein